MMGDFGNGLLRRAGIIARTAANRAGEAMVAAAEDEMPRGISLMREADDVVLTGRALMSRYWGSARAKPDLGLRQLVQHMMARGPR